MKKKPLSILMTPISLALLASLSYTSMANAQQTQTCGTDGILTGSYTEGISCIISGADPSPGMDITITNYNAGGKTSINDPNWSRERPFSITLNLSGSNTLSAPTLSNYNNVVDIEALGDILINIEGTTLINASNSLPDNNNGGMSISGGNYDNNIVLNLAETATLSLIGSNDDGYANGLDVTNGDNLLNFQGMLEIQGYRSGIFTGYGNVNINILNPDSHITATAIGIDVYAPGDFVSVYNAGEITAGMNGISIYTKSEIKSSHIVNTGKIITRGTDDQSSSGIVTGGMGQESTFVKNTGSIESQGGVGSMNIVAVATDVTVETTSESNLRVQGPKSVNIKASTELLNKYDYDTGKSTYLGGDININAAGIIVNATNNAHNNFGIAAFYSQSATITDWVIDDQGEWQLVTAFTPRSDGLQGNVNIHFGHTLADRITMQNNTIETDSDTAAIAVYAENGNININNMGTLIGEGQGISGILVRHNNQYGEGNINITNAGHIVDVETGILVSGAAKTATIHLEKDSLIDAVYGINIETMTDADQARNQINLASGSVVKGKKAAVLLSNHANNTQNELNNAGTLSSENDVLLVETNSATNTLTINNQRNGAMTGIFDIASAATHINNDGTWTIQDRFNDSAIVNLGLAPHNTLNNTGTLNFNNARTEIQGIETFSMNGGLMDLTTHTGAGTEVFIGKDTPSSTFIANGGLIKMDVVLGDDKSITDRIYVNNIVTGPTGKTLIYVNNNGGLGGLTDQGIQLIDVTSNSDTNAFALTNNISTTRAASVTLANTVVAGAYEYSLNHKTQTNGVHGWYLSSKAIDLINPINPVDPSNPWAGGGTNIDANTPLYRPDSGVNIANQQGIINSMIPGLGGNITGAIGAGSSGSIRAASRLAGAKVTGDNASVSAPKSNSLWSFVTTNTTKGHAGKGQINYKADSKMLQIGSDTSFNLGDSLMQVGLMAAYGTVKTDSTNRFTHSTGTGQTKGYSVGIYGTWYGNSASVLSPYIDVVVTHGRYDNEVSTIGNTTAKYKSNATSATLQGGYPIALASNIILEPQAQITYLHYGSNDYTDHTKTHVSNTLNGNTIGRLGTYIYGNNTTFRPYAALNVWYDNTNSIVKYNGTEVASDKKGTILEAKLGFQAQATSDLTFWGEAGIRKGKNNFKDIGGSVGLKYHF